MNKYSPKDSSSSALKPRFPRLHTLNISAGILSPNFSGNSSFTQASFSIAPINRGIKIPKLNTRTVLSSKSKIIKPNADDLEFFENYK